MGRPGGGCNPPAGFPIGARYAIVPVMDKTRLEKLARLTGRAASKAIEALERRGYDLRGKVSAPIGRVPRRAPPKPKPES